MVERFRRYCRDKIGHTDRMTGRWMYRHTDRQSDSNYCVRSTPKVPSYTEYLSVLSLCDKFTILSCDELNPFCPNERMLNDERSLMMIKLNLYLLHQIEHIFQNHLQSPFILGILIFPFPPRQKILVWSDYSK